MRYPKFLINAFATLGVFAFIFLACSVSADNSADENNPPIQNSIGKYQMSRSDQRFSVIDTETGVVKTYGWNGDDIGYLLKFTNDTAND
jgi:hypothetical protein